VVRTIRQSLPSVAEQLAQAIAGPPCGIRLVLDEIAVDQVRGLGFELLETQRAGIEWTTGEGCGELIGNVVVDERGVALFGTGGVGVADERPHEGLNNQVPASLYLPSSIRLPRKLPEFRYPKGLLLRRVNNSGDISWHKNRIFISEVFRFEELAFELITPGLHRVFFSRMEIGELDVEELRFRAARRVV
jgi:hypothetical protein